VACEGISLPTVQQAFKFWDERLNCPYIVFLSIISPYHLFSETPKQDEMILNFQDFIINPVPDQFSSYNSKLIEQYKLHHEKLNLRKKVSEIDSMKHEYFESIEKMEYYKNKESIIEEYRIRLDEEITGQERLLRNNTGDGRAFIF
jgi:hypothetical protein